MADTFVIQQFIIFFVAVMLGLIIGIAFEVVDVFRMFKRISRFVQLLIDLLFCVGATALVFFTLLLYNWGEVRVHIFLGIGTGALLYYLLLHRILRCLLVWTFKKSIAAIRFVTRPFIIVGHFLLKCAKKISSIISRMEAAGRQLQKNISFPRKKKE
ncbi:MAG: hypothetical protein GX922_02505 [Firmicutes bacterium]|nr:hypothetical protein [Bacillota bacterium]